MHLPSNLLFNYLHLIFSKGCSATLFLALCVLPLRRLLLALDNKMAAGSMSSTHSMRTQFCDLSDLEDVIGVQPLTGVKG